MKFVYNTNFRTNHEQPLIRGTKTASDNPRKPCMSLEVARYAQPRYNSTWQKEETFESKIEACYERLLLESRGGVFKMKFSLVKSFLNVLFMVTHKTTSALTT
jgi:hypothetical protein